MKKTGQGHIERSMGGEKGPSKYGIEFNTFEWSRRAKVLQEIQSFTLAELKIAHYLERTIFSDLLGSREGWLKPGGRIVPER